VKGPFRPPSHGLAGPRGASPKPPEEPEETKFFDRECYEFNRQLEAGWNDRYCEHCRHYLTARCPHIDEFLDDVEDLSPE
jgi:hypothetical protein